MTTMMMLGWNSKSGKQQSVLALLLLLLLHEGVLLPPCTATTATTTTTTTTTKQQQQQPHLQRGLLPSVSSIVDATLRTTVTAWTSRVPDAGFVARKERTAELSFHQPARRPTKRRQQQQQDLLRNSLGCWWIRGGGGGNDDEIPSDEQVLSALASDSTTLPRDDDDEAGMEEDDASFLPEEETLVEQQQQQPHQSSPDDEFSSRRRRNPQRQTSDIILNFLRHSSSHHPEDNSEEMDELRQLFMDRRDEYLEDLLFMDDDNNNNNNSPKRLLHILAPKIPSIRQSPDVSLRIQTVRSDGTAGLAACVIAIVAHLCEVYHAPNPRTLTSVQSQQRDEIRTDRRLEQLVECLVGGMDVPKRVQEYWNMRQQQQQQQQQGTDQDSGKQADDQQLHQQESSSSSSSTALEPEPDSMEAILRAESSPPQVDDGLCIPDACRAAWGLALLVGAPSSSSTGTVSSINNSMSSSKTSSSSTTSTTTIGDIPVFDVLMALSLRIRELLLARMQLWSQQANRLLSVPDKEVDKEHGQPEENIDVRTSMLRQTNLERKNWHLAAEEIAQDAATALWAFACVRAVCGLRSTALFQVCCSILCQNPWERQQQQQQQGIEDTSVVDIPAVGDEDASSSSDIGSHDVVEKLAQAELHNQEEQDDKEEGETQEEEEQQQQSVVLPHSSSKDTCSGDPCDAMLDFLSLQEICDVMWALAIHGQKAGSSPDDKKQEMDLSETAAVLCEISFDRIIAGLKQDLETLKQITKELKAEDSSVPVAVDAVEILAAEAQESIMETTATTNEHKDTDNGADAATAARAMNEETFSESDKKQQSAIEDEAVAVSAIEVLSAEAAAEVVPGETIAGDDLTTKVEDETRDEGLEHGRDTDDIEESTNELIGAQYDELIFKPQFLCSMSWAVTELKDSLRAEIVMRVSELISLRGPKALERLTGSDLANLAYAMSQVVFDRSTSSNDMIQVQKWIAQNVLQESSVDETPTVEKLLQRFQPPDLSKLMVSLSSMAWEGAKELETDQACAELSSLVLIAAMQYQSCFGAEDLSRIAFAYLVFSCSESKHESSNLSLHKLGKILTAIEVPLATWDQGQVSTKSSSKETVEQTDVQEGFSLISFFGRSRSHALKVEQHRIDDEENDDYIPQPFSDISLRYLPVDPATLCKLTHALSQKPIKIGAYFDSFCRVALTLFTANNGRLIKVCSVSDLASLATGAVAIQKTSNRELVSLFVRRLVKFLNENPKWWEGTRPQCMIDLLDAVGRLGTKYQPNKKDLVAPHKRLHLVSPLPVLNEATLETLSPKRSVSLLKAVEKLGVASVDENYAKCAVCAVAKQIDVMQAYHGEVAEILMCLATKKDITKPTKDATVPSATKEGSTTDTDANSLKCEIRDLMVVMTNIMTNRLGEYSTRDLRRTIYACATIPIQVDNFVSALRSEIQDRKETLLQKVPDLGVARKRISLEAESVQLALSDEVVDSVSSSTNPHEKEEWLSHLRESTNMIRQHALVQTTTVSSELRDVYQFEVGRCEELIEHYDRIDFESGIRQSRLDREGRHYMTKRILSRLLPSFPPDKAE